MVAIEEWRAVPGHEGLYEVSDWGRVRSLPRMSVHRNGFRRKVEGQIRRLVPAGRYLKVVLPTSDGRKVSHWVHRLVLQAFEGDQPGMNACHANGDGSDNRLVNLRWDTPHENQMDKTRHGRNHQVLKTECPRKHALSGPNVLRTSRGHRECRSCAIERKSAFAAKRSFSNEHADANYHRLLTESGLAVEVERDR